MIANDAPGGSYGTAARFKEASMASGYRICVKSCETNGTSTRLTVTNNGVAPLYRDAYFAIGDVRSTTSLKGLLPGKEISVEIAANLSNANDLKIVSDCILDTQNIEYEAGEGTGGGGDDPTPPTPTPTDDATICHFLNQTPSSNQVVVVTDNYSNSKGSVTYGGTEYGICVKMESATNITITPTNSGSVTLIFDTPSKNIKIDGTKVKTDSEGKYTFSANAGTTYTLTKGDSMNLFLVLLPEGSATGIKNINVNNNYQFGVNLAGQQVGKNYRGIAIANGKKYFSR